MGSKRWVPIPRRGRVGLGFLFDLNLQLKTEYLELQAGGLHLCSGGYNRERTVFLARGPHGNLNVLTEGGEEFHQASNGKIARAVPHEQGDLRLLHAENLGNLDLGHAAVLEDGVNLQGELRLEQFLFGIGQAQVRKDVSAALGHAGNASAFFCGDWRRFRLGSAIHDGRIPL